MEAVLVGNKVGIAKGSVFFTMIDSLVKREITF